MIAKTEAPRSVNNPTGLTLTTTLLTLPAHWAGYFINGEEEGIDAHDLSVAEACEKLYGVCSGCSETEFFEPFHDARADGVLPDDCLVYTFLQHSPPEWLADDLAEPASPEVQVAVMSLVLGKEQP